MPIDTDDFVLLVVSSTPARINVPRREYGSGSGETFSIDFQYRGGINPAATEFQVSWHDSAADRNATPPVAIGAQFTPTELSFSPSLPEEGYNYTSGSLSGRAPTLPQGTNAKSIYSRMTIVQAALNAPGTG